jgi:6-phosphogluconolactonase
MTVFNDLAELIARRLVAAIEAKGRAVLSVSGGQTPVPIFRQLSPIAIDWQNIWITQVDERFVETSDRNSNRLMIEQVLLQGSAAKARWCPMIDNYFALGTVEQAASLANLRLKQIGAADVTLLGMGNDGHFASLFAGAKQLEQGLDLQQGLGCIAVHPNPLPANAPCARISQTLAWILKSGSILLPVAGPEKQKLIAQAKQDASLQWPVSHLLRQNLKPIEVFHTD